MSRLASIEIAAGQPTRTILAISVSRSDTAPSTAPSSLPRTVRCPHCRAEIDEESEQCPKCGMYISKEDAPGNKSPVWIIVMALALLAAIALALAG